MRNPCQPRTWDCVCTLILHRNVSVGDKSLTNEQPHDAVMGDVVLVPDHFSNDHRILVLSDVVDRIGHLAHI